MHIFSRKADRRISASTGARLFLSVACLIIPFLASNSVLAGPSASTASRYPDSAARGAVPTTSDSRVPADEAQRGLTAGGTPVQRRVEQCFPAETRNVFNDVDMLPAEPGGALQPFDYHGATGVSKAGRDAIRGRNTWILWGEGNETYWGWFQQYGYGIADFLVLLDSRKRSQRFRDIGVMNQPGMKEQRQKNILGLYLDQADGDKILLRQPANDVDAATQKLALRPAQPPGHPTALFTPGDPALYEAAMKSLPQDGVDPTIYGYPSGVVGLRLMPNPDFFGNTEQAAAAREYWKKQVTSSNDAYYREGSPVPVDPKLIRPFRVSMACAYCHIGPHPLNPPADPAAPQWQNLSSTIGDQYWKPSKAFSNLKGPSSFIYQFIASQQPGTIDTSLVSTDHINNPNTMNAIFDVPGRLARADLNPPERQSPDNLRLPGIGWGEPKRENPRHTPRVLLDGADSIGVFGALARVYLNIGAFSEQWNTLHNPIIGFQPQRPFSIAANDEKSVYWRATVATRIPYLIQFFSYKNPRTGESITAPMKLMDAPGGKAVLANAQGLARAGRQVFVNNCAICHSSKQPDGFELHFSRDWARSLAPPPGGPTKLTLPMDFAQWSAFKDSAAFREYVRRINAVAGLAGGASDPFIKDNFLSTDLRVPVTLVGTNSGRAVGTNGMRGQMWDNFSSEDYKSLPAVGPVHFYNPYSGVQVDRWGNNDTYSPPSGGPGYYRPASLISAWATAPFLHNNALGLYNDEPSVDGRLRAFDDAIDKLLANDRRVASSTSRPGDLRLLNSDLAGTDHGFIYRTTQDSSIGFSGKFIHQLVAGILGTFWTAFISLYLWLGLAVVFIVLALAGRSRHAGFVFVLIAILAAAVLRMTRLDAVYGLWWAVPVIAALAALWLWLGPQTKTAARGAFGVLAIASIGIGIAANAFINGRLLDPLEVGPIPKGTPVSLIMNLNPNAPAGVLLDAAAGMTRGILRIRKDSLKDTQALRAFEAEAALPLLKASKCPDFVMDRGHWFGEGLSVDEKQQLKAFLRTL